MSDVLAEICANKRILVASRKAKHPFSAVTRAAKTAGEIRGFRDALLAASENGYGLIAEIKRASPSKGLIRADFDPEVLAQAYQRGGANCLSVLTDVPYFMGNDAFLGTARNATSLPVLRKDFMLDPYQIAESRALGADCVLLIMAALEDDQAKELEAASLELGMDVLVEVHDEEELERALELKSGLIGINNRNLKTLEVDIAMTERLAPKVPDDRTVISESGLYEPADLARMAKAGARCFLVGESLMRQADVERATRDLLAAAPEAVGA